MQKPRVPVRDASKREMTSPPPDTEDAAPADDVELRSSIFPPGEDNTVKGEILVKLTPPGTSAVSASIPTGPLGTRSFAMATGFGISEIDKVLKKAGVRAITRLHLPVSRMTAAADETVLSSTYRVRLAADADVGAAVKDLAVIAEVEEASPNRWREMTVVPDDPRYPGQWGLPQIQCPDAWDVTTGQGSVIVGVIDTGVDLDHPELHTLLVPGQDMVDLAGAEPPPGMHFEGDWMVRDDEPQDEVGHGTHVAGTIACASNNAEGVAGVTWNCSLMPVKVLTRVVSNSPPNRVSGVGSAADIAAGIRWAVDHGARIVNMSLGGYGDTFVERDAVAYAVSRGVLVVAAMGNDNTSDLSYPAAYPGVLAVGATGPGNQRARFSNFGPHIGVAAPGVDVLSTVWNDGYATMSGTSMASPHVAGVAALVLSANPALTAEEVSTIIRESAHPLRDDPGDPVPNDQYGSGLVDAAGAVYRANPVDPPIHPTNPTVTRPTMATIPLPTFPTRPTLGTFPTRPTAPTFPTQPTRPTFGTFPTQPTFPTRPTFPTTLTRPTLTRPTLTRPTLTRPTLTRPTFPTTLTRPTFPTFPTRPTAPTFPTFPTRPTAPTFPTRPTLTRPTLPTTLTRPTLPTFPTRPTAPTFPTFPTRPTAPTFPTRPTLTRPTLTILTRPTITRPTIVTRPTILTRPTLTRPTFTIQTRPTLTRPTIQTFPTVGTRPTLPGTIGPGPRPGPFGATGYESSYDPYGGSGYEDPYAGYYGAQEQTGYEGYEDPYAGYYGDASGQMGYEGYEDPYAGYYESAGQGGEDPYAGYYDPYGQGGEDPNAAYYQDPSQGGGDPYGGYYAGQGSEAYEDPYAGYYDPYGQQQTGYEGYEDPYAGYYDPYGGSY